MILHEPAVKAAAEAIRVKRYLAFTTSDEELVRFIVETYTEAKPSRAVRSRPPDTGRREVRG